MENSIQVLRVGSWDPTTWALTNCVSGTALAGSCRQEWSQEGSPGTLMWNKGILSGILIARPNAFSDSCFNRLPQHQIFVPENQYSLQEEKKYSQPEKRYEKHRSRYFIIKLVGLMKPKRGEYIM